MKIIYWLLLASAFMGTACETIEFDPEGESADICQWKNPSDIPWLQENIAQNQENKNAGWCYTAKILTGVYKKQPVLITESGGGALCCTCASPTVVYSCRGELLISCNEKELKKVKQKKVVWQYE